MNIAACSTGFAIQSLLPDASAAVIARQHECPLQRRRLSIERGETAFACELSGLLFSEMAFDQNEAPIIAILMACSSRPPPGAKRQPARRLTDGGTKARAGAVGSNCSIIDRRLIVQSPDEVSGAEMSRRGSVSKQQTGVNLGGHRPASCGARGFRRPLSARKRTRSYPPVRHVCTKAPAGPYK